MTDICIFKVKKKKKSCRRTHEPSYINIINMNLILDDESFNFGYFQYTVVPYFNTVVFQL